MVREEGLEKMAKTAKPDWRGRDWTDAKPLWHPDHPLRKLVGFVKNGREVVFDDGAGIVVGVPALGHEPLEYMTACFAAGEAIEKLGKLAPFIGLETVAWWYDHDLDFIDEPTGTPEKLNALYESIGVKAHGLVSSQFQPLLKLICGNAADASGWVSRRAAALSYWASFPPDQRPDPIPHNSIAGTSDFTKWLMGVGINHAAEKWRELRQPKMVWVIRISRNDEQVFESQKAAKNYADDCPCRHEPASNFDLSEAVVDENDGEYIQFTEDGEIGPPITRIAGEPLPFQPDELGSAFDDTEPDPVEPPDENYSESVAQPPQPAQPSRVEQAREKVAERESRLLKPPRAEKSDWKPEPGAPDWTLKPWERDQRHILKFHSPKAVADALVKLDPVNDNKIGEMPSMTIMLRLFEFYYPDYDLDALLSSAGRVAGLESENAALKARIAELENAKDPENADPTSRSFPLSAPSSD
jgi:hypothetical protein